MSRGQEKKESQITNAEFLKLINLCGVVLEENGGHDIRFVKEGSASSSIDKTDHMGECGANLEIRCGNGGIIRAKDNGKPSDTR